MAPADTKSRLSCASQTKKISNTALDTWKQQRPGVFSVFAFDNVMAPKKMGQPLRRLACDIYYERHRSFWFDIKLMTYGVWLAVRGKLYG